MKIKTRLTLGVGLLFTLIILLSVVSVKNLFELKSDTENVLVANYRTLEYSRNILTALETNSENALDRIEENLKKQEQNITEINELEVTQDLRDYFEHLKTNPSDTALRSEIRKVIYEVMNMNMQAIQRKSELAEKTAERAVYWIAITGTGCFIIAFILLVNLPANIANPIKELSESIRQVAEKNYSERVHFQSNSEFGELARSFNAMAQKLEEYDSSNLAKLMIEKKRVETLIDKMHDPVIGLDEEMRIIFANEEASQILGLQESELIGVKSKDLALKNDLLRSLIKDIDSIDENPSTVKPIKIFSKGKESYFEKDIQHISITPTGESVSKVIGHVILLRNVTEYKELDSAKTNFIANVSHEFKTPISSIKMSLQLLENEQIGALNDEQKNLVDSIKDDAGRLLKITGELLNMTQVESGNIQLSLLRTDPREIVHYAINATKVQAEQKQIKVEISCPESVSEIHADNEKTAWVITNLISNAIRYSYDNSTILVSIQEIKNLVTISVKDTGQGIAPQYKEKIFDRYFRVPGTKKEGTGLGLAISKEFIEAQGGKIVVESEFGAGSTFTVSLNKVS
ncbi:HAMP domain-containing sensor histidine kinase [Algoriphagus litoralis]|uniref:HAMP domain-containing sensor histidine kinase n=1 Tax=Algoriphagus litoralis TaxID=2202829 RepID=UPI000DBAC15E|nr:ATP-binding protein [Algoriphagus litoralis]